MKLEKALQEKRDATKKNVPAPVYEIMEKATQELISKKIGEDALKNGDQFPEIKLLDVESKSVGLAEFVKDYKFLVVSFYRGGWCPYCNLELKGLQDILPQLKELNVGLVAITPERPDYSLTTREKNELSFDVLTDEGSRLSKEIGIAFDLPESLKPVYKDFGLDVKAHNGDFTLPIPATYVLDSNLSILFSYIDIDYTKRLEPSALVDFIKRIDQ